MADYNAGQLLEQFEASGVNMRYSMNRISLFFPKLLDFSVEQPSCLSVVAKQPHEFRLGHRVDSDFPLSQVRGKNDGRIST